MKSMKLPNNRDARYFDGTDRQQEIAYHLYKRVADLPLICPHGHVDPAMFADPNYDFGSPTQLLLVPDHYVFRMLYSQGISMESLGIPKKDGSPASVTDEEAWQTFAEHFHLFAGTPTGMWLTDELRDVFGIKEKLTGESAMQLYNQISEKLSQPEFRPRAMFDSFNIEVLCTTDAASSTLSNHQKIMDSDWSGVVRPTFRPDAVVNLDAPNWQAELETLSDVSGITINSYPSFIQALEQRREFFKQMGATATDHAALTAFTERLPEAESEAIFQRALAGNTSADDAYRFTGHMLIEMARMSAEDGLVMQLHTGSFRGHNQLIFDVYGPDMGADIPVANDFTRNLHPLLNEFGNHPNLRLILFMLDEATLSRELAPLAGHYPALRLGPPWWFFDSWNGMTRYRELVSETAGLYNTVGFNDDTRAFPSIPARHDLARRVDANWIADLVVRQVVDLDDGEKMIQAAAYDLAKAAYNL